MRLMIYLNRRDKMNAINATSISEQNIIKTSSQRRISKLNEILNKVNKIIRLYEFKEINVSEIILITELHNLFNIIHTKTR